MVNNQDVQRIGVNKVVTLHFAVCLANGQVLDTTREREAPVSFTVGDGNLLEGFEKAIFGLKAGDKRSIFIEAKNGFGEWQEGNVQRFDRNLFSDELSVGLVVSFEDKSKAQLAGVVKELADSEVIVDFNHPLASKDLLFEVDIISVRDVSEQPFTLKV
ncbi:MAG: peptidylprolyl isomerase [Agitococcus sp.]|nr:peptidylprolyl isomerase [Moraxellaceae bacterium]MBK8325964.1 peptidylprolyl isomerase [Moraxellaceae bacterium]MBK9186949.1 peptidylprolyl isomerase [Moraxellaceae bacterium]MBP9216777.1 peptidylprolyl isomerase [Agitococcus sp.]MCC6374538.1 peptidylprolyl isomerase [Moraxellaceae bacterium]